MSYLLDVTIPKLPDLQVAAAKGHWRTRYAQKKAWHKLVSDMVLADHYVPDEPLSKAELECIRYSTREPDRDNLASSFKAIIDALVNLEILEDDRPSVVGSPTFRWERAKRGEGRVRVIVRAVAND